jgi:acetyltransferase-like isoleucine patch superfamily enzyme
MPEDEYSVHTSSIVETGRLGKGARVEAFARVYAGTSLGDRVTIGQGAIIYPGAVIEPSTFIGPYCVIGEPTGRYYEAPDRHKFAETRIGANSIVRSHSVIYEGVTIGEAFQSGHNINVREETVIGTNCSIGTTCYLDPRVTLGNFVRLHTNVIIGEKAVIEDFVWVFPLAIMINDPYPPMGKLWGAHIRKYALIGVHSTIMPGVEIGENAFVGAGTVVREDVPAERLVVGNPGRDVCSVRDIRDRDGNQVYPWKDFLKDFRGYPWQSK